MAVKDVIIAIDKIGFTDVILPFILVFTVVFGVLQRSKVLGVTAAGKPKTNLNAMVAFVMGFFVLVLVRTLHAITWFTRYIAVLLVAFVFLGILFALLGVRDQYKNPLIALALLLLSFVFLQSLVWADILAPETFRTLSLLIIAIAAFALILWFVLRRPKTQRAVTTEAHGKEKPKNKQKADVRETEIPVSELGPEEMQV